MYTMANCLAQDRIARGKRVYVVEPTDSLRIFLVLDFIHLGFFLSLQSHIHLGLAFSVYGMACLGLSPPVLDYFALGSSSPVRAMSRAEPMPSAYGMG